MRKLLTITIIVLSFFVLQSVQALAMYPGYPQPGETTPQPKGRKIFLDDLERTVERDPIRIEDIYYYDREGKDVYPEISTRRIAVFFPGIIEGSHINRLLQKSNLLADGYITDQTGEGTTVVFEFKEGCELGEVISVLNRFNNLELVSIASPVFIIDGEELMLNGLFEMLVKKERPDPRRIERLKGELGVVGQGISPKNRYLENYAVDFKEVKEGGMNLFKIVNHFKEDTDVVYATPLFKEAYPPVTIRQEVPITCAKIGVRLPYRIIIQRNSRVTIDQSSIDEMDMILFPKGKFIHVELDEELDESKKKIGWESRKKAIIEGQKLVITGRVWFLAPGEYGVPQKKVVYVTKEGERKIAESHDDILIKVASLVPKDSQKGFIATAPLAKYQSEAVNKAYNKMILYGVASLACMVGIAALMIFSLIIPWVKSSKAKATVDPVAESLRGFEKAIHAKDESKQYFSNVNDSLRRLLTEKTKVDVRAGAIQKVVEKLKENDENLAGKVEPILKKCEKALSKPDADNSKLKSALVKEAKALIKDFFKTK